MEKPREGWEYGRTGNPSRRVPGRRRLPRRKTASTACASRRGPPQRRPCSTCLQPGDEVLSTVDVYGGTWRLLRRVYDKYGITVAVHRMRIRWRRSARRSRAKTRLIWLETPDQPASQHRRYCRRCAALQAPGHPPGRRQHVCQPVLPEPARPRGGHRRPQHHEVHRRAQRRDRRRAGHEPAGPLRLAAGSTRTPPAGCPPRSTASSCRGG